VVKVLRRVYKGTLSPSKTLLKFILNRFVIILNPFNWILAIVSQVAKICVFRSILVPLLLLFKLSWRTWGPFKLSYLLVEFLLSCLKPNCCFCWSLVFCWSFIVFWTNLILILESFLPLWLAILLREDF